MYKDHIVTITVKIQASKHWWHINMIDYETIKSHVFKEYSWENTIC